ncbi:hypothetical protein F2Q69_00013984 [Brassica cretica]|uniref:Uncharacterized protein n=1 Tax=Brassica cretica TaxID=69181 RepID=A0A8S9QS08_BRACR|nr:hypothetical protein F2Q69_00013984 [Brassica cretica]
MDDLASKVPVGEWINIDHFSLTGAGRTYQTTKNALRMNFVHKTSISESTLQIEENFLDLVDYETILSGKPDTNILIVHCTGRKERKKFEFTLRDILVSMAHDWWDWWDLWNQTESGGRDLLGVDQGDGFRSVHLDKEVLKRDVSKDLPRRFGIKVLLERFGDGL